ncbi:DNA repair helicase RAD3 [Skeletonema marinoi]|uniref:DNA repair helicase RAD3 n=1 Tax=Skeletonema marinoi TaxID=267567 RepID=A0AAD8YIR0_9STRA|nr:DNA repair helicase RAD3 [Skeletonema marinoi]
MEGDIPTLSLTNFFVMGIKIGWPYPTVMSPQRQMAFHLIKALNSSKHVVLESPTGTGKSAAILCSVLAWQRHHWKKSGEKKEKVKIIYCSRTHSQVAQMVTSLKQTPYRPRMAILGSRERLCIHKSIKPRGGGSGEEVKGINVNNECRMRVRNTEKSRKHQLTNPTSHGPYEDDDPPDGPGDGDMGQSQQQQGEDGVVEGGESEENSFLSRQKTCPHYRQLSTSRVANLVHSAFVPNNGVDCCSIGGKESKFGAHDIEDLVQFGVDPNIQRGIALYRKEPTDSLGLSLKKGAGNRRGCFINKVKEDTPAAMNGSLQVEDRIVHPAHVSTMIKGLTKDPVVLDVTRGGSGSLSSRGGDGNYSSHAACPYYITQLLAKDAEIVFAPYNYVLDPGIREAMGIELANTVVVLDEAHNVETVLRDAGSGRFGEIELCDLIVMLNNYAIIEKSTANMLELEDGNVGESETAHLCEVAHTLLLFVEKIVNKLRDDKKYFETNPGKKGAAQILLNAKSFTSQMTQNLTSHLRALQGTGAWARPLDVAHFSISWD